MHTQYYPCSPLHHSCPMESLLLDDNDLYLSSLDGESDNESNSTNERDERNERLHKRVDAPWISRLSKTAAPPCRRVPAHSSSASSPSTLPVVPVTTGEWITRRRVPNREAKRCSIHSPKGKHFQKNCIILPCRVITKFKKAPHAPAIAHALKCERIKQARRRIQTRYNYNYF